MKQLKQVMKIILPLAAAGLFLMQGLIFSSIPG